MQFVDAHITCLIPLNHLLLIFVTISSSLNLEDRRGRAYSQNGSKNSFKVLTDKPVGKKYLFVKD